MWHSKRSATLATSGSAISTTHANASFFEYVIAKIHLRADVETLAHIASYIPAPTTVTGGAGPLDIQISMTRGLLGPDTRVSYSTPDIGIKGEGFGVKTDIEFLIAMGDPGGSPENTPTAKPDGAKRASPGERPNEAEADGLVPYLRSSSKISYVSLAAIGKNAFTIQVQGHDEFASLTSARIEGKTQVQHARVHLPKIVTEDLDDLGGLLSKGNGLQTESGRAEGSLTLELDEKRRLSGPFRATLQRASVGLDKLRASTDGEAQLFLSLDPGRDRATVKDCKRIDLAGLPGDAVNGDVSIAARDAEPVIRALAEDGKVPEIVADIIKLKDLKVLAKVRKTQNSTDIMLDTLESRLVDVSGRIYDSPKQSRLALLIGGEAISLGIDRHDGHTGFEAFAGSEWLNERLSHFPKPVEKVSGDKP